MSTVVSPLPSGGGVAAVAEHRAHRDTDEHHTPDRRHHDEGDRADPGSGPATSRRGEAPAPAADDPAMPAETLFAAALLGGELLKRPPSTEEMRLRTGQGWAPPDSPLQLKDKLI
jgi:hypothetical protein